MTAFNIAFLLLQIPLGVIGVPLGIVVLPTLSRDAAGGRPIEYAGAHLPGPPAARLFVMLPIAGLGIVLRVRGRRRCCSATATFDSDRRR